MIAVCQRCRRPPIYYPELSFPAARIVEDRFDASYQFVEKSRALYAGVSVTACTVAVGGGQLALNPHVTAHSPRRQKHSTSSKPASRSALNSASSGK